MSDKDKSKIKVYQELIETYKECILKDREMLGELKQKSIIMIIGNSNAGKSSLACSLLNGPESITVGDDGQYSSDKLEHNGI